MNVLLFTHRSDIDGLGNVVLAKLAFDTVDYILCETFNLQDEISKYYNNGEIYKYDMIYVTDMWLEEPMLSKISNDAKLINKFLIFDHHESALAEGFNKYPFTTIRISDENGLCSGTSLFYEYLISNDLITSNKIIKDFSELTRKYDTWEWKAKYNDELPHELALLFDSVGCEEYINLMYQKLSQENTNEFSFNELEKKLIENKVIQVQEKVSAYSKNVHYVQFSGLKAGIVFIDYEYRNDLAEYFRQKNFDMDFAMLIALDYGTISYRKIKNNVNVRLIAEAMGGKGHDSAASSPVSKEQFYELIKLLLNN